MYKKIVEENGAIFQNVPMVLDGKVITANGSGAAKEFAQGIIEAIE